MRLMVLLLSQRKGGLYAPQGLSPKGEWRSLCASGSLSPGRMEGTMRLMVPLFLPKKGGLYAPHISLIMTIRRYTGCTYGMVHTHREAYREVYWHIPTYKEAYREVYPVYTPPWYVGRIPCIYPGILLSTHTGRHIPRVYHPLHTHREAYTRVNPLYTHREAHPG